MISKIEIPDGIDMPVEPDILYASVLGIVTAQFAELVLLEEGVYDVTPRIWTKNLHDHELGVLSDGNGMYRTIPKGPNFGFFASSGRRDETVFNHGGITTPIHQGQPIAIIGGRHPTKDGLHIFGLIVHDSIESYFND
jgi:hypothetical protein